MSLFKVNCQYLGIREKKFFKDKKPVDYHKFSVEKPEELPRQIFNPSTQLGKGSARNTFDDTDYCWLFISTNLVKQSKLEFKKDQKYNFLMKLGEPKTADFTIYYYVPPPPYGYEEHSMVLKSKDYWENTVQKIGFWGSENYFYERDKKQKNPSQKPNNNNQSQSENKKVWVKIAWICLPISFFFFCLFLFTKWINKKQK